MKKILSYIFKKNDRYLQASTINNKVKYKFTQKYQAQVKFVKERA